VLCIALLGGAGQAHADTFHVPSAAHPTVQSALDAAHTAPGADTVSLAASSYRENVRVNPQHVTITAPAGPDATVLDATGQGESAIRILGGQVTVRGLTITGGTGTGTGGRRGGGVQLLTPEGGTPARATFANCVIAGNSALDPNSNGGGVFVGSESSATFNACTIDSNSAGDGGGGIFGSVDATIRVNGGTIGNNAAGVNSAAGGGGGIAVADADLLVRGTAITGNTSTAVGGAVHAINHLSTTERTVAMSDCDVSGNTTASEDRDDQGGGIHIEDRVSLVMTGCTVVGNQADSGGGISSFRGNVSVTDSVIADNEATNPQGVGGGGVMSIGAQTALAGRCPVVRLTRSAVVGNFTASRGGGIYSSEGAGCGGSPTGVATLDVAASTVSDNTTAGSRGGGVGAINTRLDLTDSHVNGNSVEGTGGVGGGVLVSEGLSTATIARTTIATNSSPESAAGVLVVGGGNPTLDMIDSYLYANRSANPDPSRGGGLAVTFGEGSGIAATGTVRGNVIADNSSWQIAEPDHGRTNLVYSDNRFGTPAPDLGNLIYRSTGRGVILELATTSEFNAATLGAPDRTAGNVTRAPDFVSLMAAPERFVPEAPGTAWLSWSAARASETRLVGDPGTRPATDVAEVTGGACDESRTFELLVERAGGEQTHPITLTGPPCEPAPVCPAGTTPSVTCSRDDGGRLVFVGTRAPEVLRGTSGADVMVAGGGADRLWGDGGVDRLNGGSGGDRLTGAGGKDDFTGGNGRDRINSKGERRERVRCGTGRDRVRGARGDRVKRDCERVRR
jgi:RTX calcium-binding nonapeptide repeat (4 copies)